jgi:hypothetical protein
MLALYISIGFTHYLILTFWDRDVSNIWRLVQSTLWPLMWVYGLLQLLFDRKLQ